MPDKEKNKTKLGSLRNIGIIAHIDSGKTTLTESILYLCQMIRKIGKVHEGGATTDFLKEEKERGITIQSAAVTVKWEKSIKNNNNLKEEYQINLIDTPGHIDFTVEVERSLRVLDGSIVVLDGKKGVEAQTETVWRQADKYKVPRIIFINKMDGAEEDSFEKCLFTIKNKLHATTLEVQFPIGFGKELEGIVDIIEQKFFSFEMGDREENYQIKEIPSSLKSKTEEKLQELIGKIIDQDEIIANKYLEGKELTIKEIRELVRKATLTGKYFPVFCGSAYKHGEWTTNWTTKKIHSEKSK